MTLVYYRYRNPGFGTIDLWVGEPRDGLTQHDVRTVRRSHVPREWLNSGANAIARYRVGPFQTFALDWEFVPIQAGPGGEAGDLSHFLRTSPQIGLEPELVAEAHRLAEGVAGDAFEAARALFLELAGDRYRYHVPVFRRGALAMQRSHRGDCGQFSALFVAWCRALGIPARAVVGTMIDRPAMVPHVWAEFWVDGRGWLPVDPTFGQTSDGSQAFFGQLPSDRFAFSSDFDVDLPGYGGPVRLPPLNALLCALWLGSRHLRWGAGTLEGTAPYLQPAYPRMYAGWGPDFVLVPPTNGVWNVGSPPSLLRVAGPQAIGVLVLCALAAIFLSDINGNRLLGHFGQALIGLSVVIAAVIARRTVPT